MILKLAFLDFLVVLPVAFALVWRSKALLVATYKQGQRDSLKDAIKVAKDRADVAVLVAPAGLLNRGLARAQAADEIAMDIRNLLKEVR